MRTSASSAWVTRNRTPSSDKRRPAVRFARADFKSFDGVPQGFSRFSEILNQENFAPDPDLLAKARKQLVDKRQLKGLAGLRLAKGLSQKDLAEMIGTSQPRLSTWEGGSEKPGFESIKRLRDALRVTADEILEALDV